MLRVAVALAAYVSFMLLRSEIVAPSNASDAKAFTRKIDD